MALSLHTASGTAALDQQLADWAAAQLRSGLAQRGRATLVVSGGRTPLGFFACLREAKLDWAQVMVTLADERWVPVDHADSNEKLVRAHLLQGAAAAANFVSLKFDAATPQAGAELASTALAAYPEAFDAVVLGMGEDGHTASLFPGSPQLIAGLYDASGAACLATENTSKAPRWRITLSAPRLRHSRAIALHLTGAAKWALLGKVLGGDALTEFPVRLALQPPRESCHVFWCP